MKNTIELKNAQRVTDRGQRHREHLAGEPDWLRARAHAAKPGQHGALDRGAGRHDPFEHRAARQRGVSNPRLRLLSINRKPAHPSHLHRKQRVRRHRRRRVGRRGAFSIDDGGPANITVDHNTVFHNTNIVLIDTAPSQGFVFTNNLMKHNTFGIFGSGVDRERHAVELLSRTRWSGATCWLAARPRFIRLTTSSRTCDVLGAIRELFRAATTRWCPAARTSAVARTGRTSVWISPPSRWQGGRAGSTRQCGTESEPGGPYSGRPGAAIGFDGRGSRDPNGTIASYRWDWGDGTSAGSGATPTHTYASAALHRAADRDRQRRRDRHGDNHSLNSGSVHDGCRRHRADGCRRDGHPRQLGAHLVHVRRRRAAHVEHQQWLHPVQGAGRAPANYFEAPFMAAANTNYRVWLRLRAPSGSKHDDSVWVQFTGAVSSRAPRCGVQAPRAGS